MTGDILWAERKVTRERWWHGSFLFFILAVLAENQQDGGDGTCIAMETRLFALALFTRNLLSSS